MLLPARLLLLMLVFAGPALASEEPVAAVESGAAAQPVATPAAADNSNPRVEYFWELDAYYSDVGASIRLDDSPVPDGGKMSEVDVYRSLFLASLRPRLLMLEASVYPMPAGGAWIKGNHRDFYDDMVLASSDGSDLNIIDSLTAGFQEPWAVSAFLGSEMTFTREGDRKRKGNSGYMGYLVSMGRKHIRNNQLIDDTWVELEWKLKGEREFRDEKLSWSFRGGLKNHGNPYVRDVAYLGFRRSSLDFNQPLLRFFANSNIDMKTEFASDDATFLRQDIIIGKKMPIKRWRIAPSVEFGLIIEKDAKYSGPLADPLVDQVTFVFRPNIDW